MTPADGSVLAFAGIWSRWGPDGLLTFSVLTTAATGGWPRYTTGCRCCCRPRWDEWLTAPAGPACCARRRRGWPAGDPAGGPGGGQRPQQRPD